jgi:hypothetical protein
MVLSLMPVFAGPNGKLQYFSPEGGGTWPYPSVENPAGIVTPIPCGNRSATGNQVPANKWHTADESLNWNHWDQGPINGQTFAQRLQIIHDYCKANNMALAIYLYYYFAPGGGGKGGFENYLHALAPYCQDIPWYFALSNETLDTNGTHPIEQDYGGAGTTYGTVAFLGQNRGFDWLVNMGRDVQAILGPNVKLGLNDYNVESINGQHNGRLAGEIALSNLLKNNGVSLAWFGMEGYWLDRDCLTFNGVTIVVMKFTTTLARLLHHEVVVDKVG